MARKVYARRYAQAVFDIALEAKELDRWRSDLGEIATLTGEAELVALLESPKVPFATKSRLLSERLAGASPLALNLACLLVARGRLGMAGDVAREYQQLLNSHRGVELAEVATAVPLDEEDRQRLAKRLGAITGKKITVEAELDPSLVAGITARIGGKLLDGSTHSKLAALKRELARGGR